jgi:hypothetical protein
MRDAPMKFPFRSDGVRCRLSLIDFAARLAALLGFIFVGGRNLAELDPRAGSHDLDPAKPLDALSRPGHFLEVNIFRTAIGEEKFGHFSPLAVYDAASDRFSFSASRAMNIGLPG